MSKGGRLSKIIPISTVLLFSKSWEFCKSLTSTGLIEVAKSIACAFESILVLFTKLEESGLRSSCHPQGDSFRRNLVVMVVVGYRELDGGRVCQLLADACYLDVEGSRWSPLVRKYLQSNSYSAVAVKRDSGDSEGECGRVRKLLGRTCRQLDISGEVVTRESNGESGR